MLGYSGTSLPKKLGIRPGQRLLLVGAPRGFERMLGELPDGARLVSRGEFDLALAFFSKRRELEQKLQSLVRRLHEHGGLWIAWPKQASDVATDVRENDVRRLGLEAGLVDNKIAAIDETWSGLRLVVRVRDRKSNR
jgi:hypothetical protein